MIKAMSAPYTKMKFMPTGGINAGNLNDYLSFGKILACGGSWMVSDKLINAQKFDEITALTKEAVHTMLGFKLKHIGINEDAEAKALKDAKTLCTLFGFQEDLRSVSVFAGSSFELMFQKGNGTNGHIAIGTNSVPRAYSYLKRIGVEFDEDSKKFDENGNLKFVYLKDEIGGFAFHLV